MKTLKHESIKTIISYARDVATSYSTVLLSDVGERTILVYRGASDNLPRARALETRAVYVAPGAMPHQPLLRLLCRYKSAGSMIAMNPSGHYIKLGMKMMQKFFELLDVVIMNREESASLTGIAYQEEKNILSRLREILPGIIVVTDGAKGSTVLSHDKMFRAGIFHNEQVIDRTGAGDAFGSGFIAGIMQRTFDVRGRKTDGADGHTSDIRHLTSDDIQYAIRCASANATSVVEVVGATPGILTKAQFDGGERWKNFEVQINTL